MVQQGWVVGPDQSPPQGSTINLRECSSVQAKVLMQRGSEDDRISVSLEGEHKIPPMVQKLQNLPMPGLAGHKGWRGPALPAVTPPGEWRAGSTAVSKFWFTT